MGYTLYGMAGKMNDEDGKSIQESRDLEEQFLSNLLLDPKQLTTLAMQKEDFTTPLTQAAFGAIVEVFQTYGFRKDFLSLVCEAMNRLEFIRNRGISPYRYLERIGRLANPEGLDLLAAQIKVNSPRIRGKNSVVDKILTALQDSGNGLTRTQINNLFLRHKTRTQLNQAINYLLGHGLIISIKKRTPGRSVEQFKAK